MTRRAPLRTAAAGTIVAVLAALVLAADQFAKYLAIQNLPPEEPVPIIGDFLIFYLVRNPGAAFSLGEGVTWIFTIALAVVAGVIIWLIARVHSRAWAITLGLLLGGVLGNLTDRLFRPPGFAVGHVVDFISTPWMIPAIYNISDMFIVCSMITVAILVLIGIRFDGTRDRRGADDSDEKPADGSPIDEVDSDAERIAAVEDSPTAVEGFGADRNPLFPTGDPTAGAPLPQAGDPAPGDAPMR